MVLCAKVLELGISWQWIKRSHFEIYGVTVALNLSSESQESKLSSCVDTRVLTCPSIKQRASCFVKFITNNCSGC